MRPLDLDQLLAFVTTAEAGNLSRAAQRLRLSQPTVSMQLKKLEESLGSQLAERTPRSFKLTGEGEILLSYGKRILTLAEEARAKLTEAQVAGQVRLGTPEDFATTHLSSVLAAFIRTHPHVGLEVTTDLTLNLIDRFQGGEFDLVLIKREPLGPSEGVRVWSEPLVWTCGPDEVRHFADVDRELPLVVSPHPCVYRKRAVRALDQVGRRWRVAYTSTSLAGAQAAVKAGLGITVLPAGMVPAGFVVLDRKAGLPPLAATEIALMRAPGLSEPAKMLAKHMVSSLER